MQTPETAQAAVGQTRSKAAQATIRQKSPEAAQAAVGQTHFKAAQAAR
jgi:hypothetical protein